MFGWISVRNFSVQASQVIANLARSDSDNGFSQLPQTGTSFIKFIAPHDTRHDRASSRCRKSRKPGSNRSTQGSSGTMNCGPPSFV